MKKVLVLAMCFVLVPFILMGCGTDVTTEAFPNKDITLIVPFGAGGGTDALARKLAEIVKTQSGVNIIVTNKTGGSGAVGMAEGALADDDGYTVTMTTVEVVLLPLAGLASFTTADFKPIIRVNFDAAALIVQATNPADTLAEFIANATAKSTSTSINTSAFPTNYWLAGAMLKELSTEKLNLVEEPAGAAAEIQNLLGGHVDAIICTMAEASQYVASGDFKFLAVASTTRNAAFPDVPTFIESGYQIEVGTWRGFMVPDSTDAAIVAYLDTLFTAAYQSQEFQDFLVSMKFGAGYLNSTEFGTLLTNQTAQYEPIISKYVD